jgi:hypothetical protein
MKKMVILIVALGIFGCLGNSSFGQRRTLPVRLNVTIDDIVSQTAGIQSDGAGAFQDGQHAVTAVLTEYGWFNFISGTRTVTAVYSTPIEILTPLATPSESGTGVTVKTFVTSLKIQDMAIGQSQCVGMAVNFSYNDPARTVRTIGYRAGRGTITTTGYVLITHPNADTWILEPTPQTSCGGTDNSLDNIARIRDATTKGRPTPDIDYGRYYLPFRLTLTRQ